MDTLKYYDLVDAEIGKIINELKDTDFFGNNKEENGMKSKAFLVWYLRSYAPDVAKDFTSSVDGDDDNSCDIIYKYVDSSGKDVFNVVQAKWFSKKNVNKAKEISKEIKACIDDFRVILKGNKESTNEQFTKKYCELMEHKALNGKINFVFLSLSKNADGANDNIEDFTSSSLITFEKLHVEKLKRIYIERNFKNAKALNPLEIPCKPNNYIALRIQKENYIKIEAPYKSYVFITTPEQIHDLYENYGDSLFYSNIRNPLERSPFNESIRTTIEKDSMHFWYFNNGITAITDLIHDFHKDAEVVTIRGLQIINGAQTVCSIYEAYKAITDETKKELANINGKIMIRVLSSGGPDHDFKVTKYTNSQNPVINRDFHANDDIQSKIQNSFFENGNIWYEKRRGEFKKRRIPKEINIISNELFAQIYLAYGLQLPVTAKNNKKYIFVTRIEDKDYGLYETIFDNASYDEMLAGYYIYSFVEEKRRKIYKDIKAIDIDENGKYSTSDLKTLNKEFALHATFHIVSLFRIILLKDTTSIQEVNGKIISAFKNAKTEVYESTYNRIIDKAGVFIEKQKQADLKFSLSKYFKSGESYEKLKNLV